MLYATQVHPHDVRDEGAATVAERIAAAGIRVIAAETGTLEERHPYPHGELPHNPRHRVLVTRANLDVPIDPRAFAGGPVRPRLLPVIDDWFGDLLDAGRRHGVTVIPWIKALNGSFEEGAEEATVRTLDGAPVEGWLCPSHPETAMYVVQLILAVVRRYGAAALLLDRVRYPDWSGPAVDPQRLATCFCGACVREMERAGIDVARLEAELRELLAYLSGDEAAGDTNPLDTSDVLREWLRFRQHQVTNLVTRVRDALAREGLARTTFWLNLWPPSFAWLLGQDYPSLGRLCHGAKHFPYHRLGGGADLAGLVRALTAGYGEERQERAFARLRRLVGLPDVTFRQFVRDGLPVAFVAGETQKAKAAFASTPVFTGIQIWDVPQQDIVAAVQAARAAQADGLFFYCYGWATLGALEAVGRLIRSCASA